jgi:cytochrome b pre-mRNA-processing protein 3
MLKRLFKPRPAQLAGRALYVRAVDRARAPRFYAGLGVPDTVEGRFELYSLHVYLILARLKDEGPQAAETGQALFDAYVKSLDDALREMGVGDLSVGKKMRKLGEAFYGRVKSYEEAFAALPERGPLEDVITRTVYAGVEPRSGELADHVLAEREALAAQPLERLLAGEVEWGDA